MNSFLFDASKKALSSLQYTFWNYFALDHTLYPSYNQGLSLLHEDDEFLLEQYAQKKAIEPVFVTESPGKGNGLFASKCLIKNEFVTLYSGLLVSQREYAIFYKNKKNVGIHF
jgi:hypothetical protein